MQNGRESSALQSVDKFVAARALNFNNIQRISTRRLQMLQQESFGINKNP
jgi:hypothetical protein